MGYKDPSIYGPRAMIRGFFFGRKAVGEFRRAMERGASIDDFMGDMSIDTSGQYGMVSPVGEFIGYLTHPIEYARGVYYHARNENKKRG